MSVIESIFNGLNNALLKMTWLDDIVAWLLRDVFGMNPDTMLFEAVNFFLYDVIKIIILLSILIYISTYIQSYFTPERTRKILSRYKGFWANLLGALLGTVTPFCSCSSIPIFMGFTRAGLPIGVTFSFLISSPLVDLASLVLIIGFFGWTFAAIYVVVGLILAVIGGGIISMLKMEDEVAEFLKVDTVEIVTDEVLTKKQRRKYAADQTKEIIKRVWKYVLVGVSIGALIHGYIPQELINSILGSNHWYSVIVAVVAGIPMYADIFGTLPIAEALVQKGVGLGTVLAFMMAVTTLSIPSLILLKNVIKKRLMIVFVSIVSVGIIVIGYLFNLIYQLI